MPDPTIVAIGGGAFRYDERYRPRPSALTTFALSLTGKEAPKVSSLHTATGDPPERISSWYQAFAGTPVQASHLALFPMPNHDDVRAHLLAQDAIFVNGGSVANLLACWHAHGLPAIFREAWEAGVVLFGSSAGMLCWFECGVTDSFRPALDPFGLDARTAGVGLIPGSACPHYDEEANRRPVYQRLVGDGTLPAGYAADGGVGLHFTGSGPDLVLAEAVTERDGSAGWRVEPDGSGGITETRIEARRLLG